MKTVVLIFAVIVITLVYTNIVIAQGPFTNMATATASATILNPITIKQSSDLHFGSMAVSVATPGTCAISTQGVRTNTGGVNLSASGQTNASFVIKGEKSITYSIILPSNVTITDPTSLCTMSVNNLTARPASSNADGLIGTLNSNGEDKITIGGTLNVQAGQTIGVYTGTFSVTVAYN